MKARIKNVEDASPEHLCCEAATAAMRRNQGKVVELVGSAYVADWKCNGCGTKGEEAHYDVSGQPFSCVGVSLIDIEEGP